MKLSAHFLKPQIIACFTTSAMLGIIIILGQENSYTVPVLRRIMRYFWLNSYYVLPLIEYYFLRLTVVGIFVFAFLATALSPLVAHSIQGFTYNQQIVENHIENKNLQNRIQKFNHNVSSMFAPPNISGLPLAALIIIGFTAIFAFYKPTQTYAAAGIYERINFQGKLQNANGTNVTDGNYSVVFTLYDASSGGSNLWDETQTVAVADGVFQVELGAIDTTIGSVDFNSDTIYLGVKVEADAEMTPRIRFTAVPYAFNAEKVSGLTVTNTTGTFTLANSKTLTVNNTLTFSGTDGTTFTFPSGTGTVVTLDSTGALSNKTLTAPRFVDGGFIADSNGAEMLIFDLNASAVNELTISNGATGVGPTIIASGETDVPLTINSKAAGAITLDSGTTGAVNIGVGNNAKTISIATGTAGNIVNIGTNNTTSDTITIGSALDNVAITGDSWSITDAGALTVVSCSGCGGGSQTPWTQDINAAGYDLRDLSNLEFQATTGAPAGTVVGIYSDNTGDLNLNALSTKSINLQVAGSDEYNFSSTTLGLNGNSLTSVGGIELSANQTINPGSSGTLGIGTANTTVLNLGVGTATTNVIGGNIVLTGNTSVSSGNTFTVTSGEAVITGQNSGAATTLRVNNHTSTGSIFVAQDAATPIFTIADGGSVFLNTFTTDANAILYTSTTGVITRVVETETGSQCLLSGAGASGIPTWGSCGGGAQTPWTSDIDGDNFSLLDMGTNITSRAGLTVGSGTDTNLTLTPGGTGDTIITGDADSNLQLNFGAAPAVDMHVISNAGFGTTTDGVDGLYINFVQADDAGVDSNYGLNIGLTVASDDAGEVLGAINLSVTGQTANNRERGITIGSGFDEDIYFASASAQIRIQDGGEIEFTDGSYGGAQYNDIPLARIKEYFTGANYGVVESTGFINIDGSFYMENFNRAAPAVTADQTGSARVIGDTGAWALDERGTGGTATNATFGCTATPGTTNTSEAVNGVLEIALETSTNANGTNLTPPWCLISMSSVNGNAVIPILQAANKFIMYYKVKMSSAYTNSVTGNMMWFGAENQTNGGWIGKPTFTGTSTGGVWVTNVDGTQTQTGTNATAGTQWIGWARYNGANSTVACSGFNPTSQTSNYALFRIEVRATNDARFFIDGDTSNGVSMTECGQVTNNIPTRGIRPSINMGRPYMNNTGTVWTAYVDLFAYVQDDPRDVIPPEGLSSEAVDSPPFSPIAGADVAEHYIFTEDDKVEPGDVVSVGDLPGDGDKAKRSYDRKLLGVVAQSPGLVLGESAVNSLPVAITGRVPVKVSNKNGAIKIGDPITTSDIPGVGMKATQAGKILGTAMENYDKEEVSKILITVSPGYYVSDGQDVGLIENKDELVLGASQSGVMDVGQGIGIDATGSAKLISKDETNVSNTVSGAMDKFMLFSTGVRVDQILQVMGDAVFYGAVKFEGAAEFLARVIFRNEVEFEKTVTFNSDSAGYAVIKKGQKFVDVLFESEYKNNPVIHISPTIFKLTDETFKNLVSEGFCLEQEGIEVCQDKLVSTILDGDARFAVQNQNTQGFLIVLDKEAPVDLTFSWQAVAVKNIKTAENLGPANLMPPYKGSHKITNKYGEHAQNEDIKEKDMGQGLKGHDGYDISLPSGTPIVAVDSGVVEGINSDYGVTLVLKHAWGKSVYGHLSKTHYKEGEIVQKGQEIALSGDSGLTTGSHLHFGIKLNNSKTENGYNGFVNPNLFISFEQKSGAAVAGVSDSKSDTKKDDPLKLEVKEEENASTSAKITSDADSSIEPKE